MGRQNQRSSGPSKAGEELHAAARSGDLTAVQIILASNPLAVNSRDKHSRTPLHLAAWSGHSQVATYLCQHKADVGASAMDDMGAIHFAAQKGHLEIVKVLVSSGVSVKASTRKGFTPLHYAAQGGHLELAKYLVKKGASLSTENKVGKTPTDLAGNEEVRSFLEECEKSPEKVESLKGNKKAEEKPVSNDGDDAGRSSKEDEGEDEGERLKRKVDEEETKEASLPKKVKVTLNHLMSADDTQEEEEY
ncbi:hypothetical protein CRG98_035455 [Punica granatum]|uniref:Uncharacterized protein n=2 Tax=Punica granatum TaxID=22663 RepID=A0A2I0IJL2_PUNGR|nr:hypothetical protein CRG98_035455 [Punica granatum]